MNPIVRNVLAVIGGYIAGSFVNVGLIMVGPMIIPPPAGVDIMDMESLAQNIHLFGPHQFIFPFLAHALGTLAGALLAYRLAASRRDIMAWIIGACFLLGGITSVMSIPAPVWFMVVDLVFAYGPMAWLAIYLARKLESE